MDFAFETTLAGKGYANIFKQMKRDRYEIHLFFLWLPDVRLALARVAARVRKGGHNIPEQDVKRRFKRGIWNLFHVYRELFDTWTVFDNSTTEVEIIVKSEKNVLSVINRMTYRQLLKQAKVKDGI